MINKSPIKRNKRYYEALGPAPKWVLSPRDFYRFKRVKGHLYGNSVLDVGCGRADFLKLIKPDYQIAGIEITKVRVADCNTRLGQNAVKLSNLDGRLDFEDDSFDTVVSLEVLEHLEDPEKALKDLIRISRKRIIVTVPFNEKIQYVLCIHCAKYTPVSGHLHTFNKENIKDIIPNNARIVRIELIANRALSYFLEFSSIFRLPIPISSTIDNILNHINPRACWVMVILDKK